MTCPRNRELRFLMTYHFCKMQKGCDLLRIRLENEKIYIFYNTIPLCAIFLFPKVVFMKVCFSCFEGKNNHNST